MALDFVSTYFPDSAELTATELQSARARLKTWLQPSQPDLDMRPGSVYGTWVLDPFAQLLAGFEVALGRLRADLDVGGVSQGIVFDCDFVEAYLGGLGGKRQEALNTVGYVRLEFDSNIDVDIPGGLRIRFNDQDIFLPLSYPTGPLRVRQVGTVAPSATTLPLRLIGPSRYAVVLPVVGFAAAVEAGATAQWDTSVAGLVSITAVSDFVAGRSNNSVPAIAARTAQTFHASGFATRSGIRREIELALPDITGVTTTMASDPEMLRTGSTALGVGDGVVDVHVRSRCRATYEQSLYIPYIPDQVAVMVERFLTVWTPLAQPTRIQDIRWTGDLTLPLTFKIYSRSASPARAPLLTCAYSNLEEYEIAIEMPKTPGGVPRINLDQTNDGNFAWFKITYEADAAVAAVQQYADHETPAGLDVLIKAPVQLVITKLVFNYTRQPGILFNTEQAQQDIEQYMAELMAPDRLSVANLQDRLYSAGADRITSVETRAQLRLSVADFVVPEGTAAVLTNYAAVVAAARPVPVISLNDIQALNPTYTDPLVGESTETLGAVGRRNIAYTLLPDALAFHHDETA